ncbi:MAG: ankyrin repeat domain-containing protein [Acidobacteriaceae bacterium]|nr:ankyrin repeat domain-containing protein [Acidobacteriaceae bacterium]
MKTIVASLLIAVLLLGCTARSSEPLAKAAATGDLKLLGKLLAGASLENRQTALVWAARSGQPGAIELLIRAGVDPNFTWGVNGWPVLMHAIHKDQPGSVEMLLEHGADVNQRGGNGETPLMMAAGYGYTDIAGILLEHGADAHATLSNGENALDFAAEGVADLDRFTWGRCQTGTVKLLRERVPDLSPKEARKLKSCS